MNPKVDTSKLKEGIGIGREGLHSYQGQDFQSLPILSTIPEPAKIHLVWDTQVVSNRTGIPGQL